MYEQPAFIRRLADILTGDPLREKLVLAPSRRVGRQWLDQAAAISGGIVNARAATMRRLLLDLAEPALARQGLRPADRQEKTAIVGRILADLAATEGDGGYFSRLPLSLGLAESLLATLEELEESLVRDVDGLSGGTDSIEKKDELDKLMRRYRLARREAGLAGVGETQAAALETLARSDPGRPLLAIPAGLFDEFTLLEKRFLSRWPIEDKSIIAEDGDTEKSKLVFFAADSAANEAREVLRRIQASALPLDKVEVVCVDAETYVPALCAVCLETFGGKAEELPVTFSGGLPGHYARPVRRLTAWLEWLETGLPPEGLARMVESGLLGDGWRGDAAGIAAPALVARLRELPINGAPEEYRTRLGTSGRNEELNQAEAWLARLLPDILPLANGGADLTLDDAQTVLAAARNLLAVPDPHEGKLDAYARTSLEAAVTAWLPQSDWPGFDPLSWLSTTTEKLRIMGLGPMPGRLHVADLLSGGHSGREYLFVLGLDDGRFPGVVRQDPVLLDRERSGISANLRGSGWRRRRRELALTRLLGQPRDTTFLSYSRYDAEQGRELFPAVAFARLAGENRASLPGLAVLVPDHGEKNLTRRDDWFSVLLAEPANTLRPSDLAAWFPGLGEGEKAAAARESDAFTQYDGRVEEAGVDFFAAEAPPPLSPSHLELLAKCPLDFFFNRILGIKPPERYEPRIGGWLEGRDRGNLLHELFQDFLLRGGESAGTLTPENMEENAARLERMLVRAVEREQRRNPPRDDLAYRRELGELEEACDIFLRTELERQKTARPLYMEVELGGAEEPRTPWDRKDPVELEFGPGERLLLRGRVDRIDRRHDNDGLIVIDYKTGRSDKFPPDDPFRQGRNLQHYLYSRMLETALAELGRPDRVRNFAYFFPMPRDEGKSVVYDRETLLREGTRIMALLTAMLASGAFPFTTDAGDVEFSDYLPLYPDPKTMAKQAAAKAAVNPELSAWAELRGKNAVDETDEE